MRGDDRASFFLNQLAKKPSACVVTLTELLAGSRSQREDREIEALGLSVSLLSVDQSIARRAGQFMKRYSASHGLEVTLSNAGFGTTTFNYINRETSENQAVDTRRSIIAVLTSVSSSESIAAVLGRHGIRHGVSFEWSTSKLDEIREELSLDAIAAATAKAKRFGERSGGVVGHPLDVVVAHAASPSPVVSETITLGSTTATFAPQRTMLVDSVIEDAGGRGYIVRVMATVTLQARSH